VEANLTLLKQMQNTFVSQRAAEKWRECCEKAADCCRDMIEGRGVIDGEYYKKDFFTTSEFALPASGEFSGMASIAPPYHLHGRNDFLSVLNFPKTITLCYTICTY